MSDVGDAAMPIVMTTLAVGNFLIEHGDMIEAILAAKESGASHDQILAGIRSSMILASEALVTADLGPRP